jgi:hypothetical protein
LFERPPRRFAPPLLARRGDGSPSTPSFFKKSLYDLPAFQFANPSRDLQLMIQSRVPHHVVYRSRCPEPQICRPKHQPLNPCVNDCAGTHYTRLHGAVERQPGQTVVSQDSRRSTHGNDLRMSRRIVRRDRLIESLRKDTSRFIDEHCTNGNFSRGLSESRLVQSDVHELPVQCVIHAVILFHQWRRRFE